MLQIMTSPLEWSKTHHIHLTLASKATGRERNTYLSIPVVKLHLDEREWEKRMGSRKKEREAKHLKRTTCTFLHFLSRQH